MISSAYVRDAFGFDERPPDVEKKQGLNGYPVDLS
jgi:hypothetical protein